MNTNATIEYIRAKENICPSTVWEFSVLDRACFSMVIRGTWIFDLQLDVNVMKAGLKKLLNYYPYLSGRMKDKTGIHLTNDGVPFTVTHESGLSIADAYKKHNLQVKKVGNNTFTSCNLSSRFWAGVRRQACRQCEMRQGESS